MKKVSLTLIVTTLALLMIVLTTFDVRGTLYEDGSIRVTMCIPWLLCDQPYIEPEVDPLPAPNYGGVVLPTVHY